MWELEYLKDVSCYYWKVSGKYRLPEKKRSAGKEMSRGGGEMGKKREKSRGKEKDRENKREDEFGKFIRNLSFMQRLHDFCLFFQSCSVSPLTTR